MLKLILIADDITGAMDTGIKFAEYGVASQLMIWPEVDFSDIRENTEVLIVDSESRHVKPEEAYEILYRLIEGACQKGVVYIYKKTDSALRGNVGSELAAVLDACRDQGRMDAALEFIPAMPGSGRTTRLGRHYIKGVPLNESAIGQDPFDPVISSYVPDILNKDRKLNCRVIVKNEAVPETRRPCINIYDAETEEDIRRRTEELAKKKRLRLMAGCAGFAAFLQEALRLRVSEKPHPRKTNQLAVLSGTLNEVTKKQIFYAKKRGFQRIALTERQKWEKLYFSSLEGKAFLELLKDICTMGIPLMIDVFSAEEGIGLEEGIVIKKENSGDVAERMAEIGQKLLGFDKNITFLTTGGDTTVAFLKKMRCKNITLIREVTPGLVLFEADAPDERIQIISKAGGLGCEEAIIKAFEALTNVTVHGVNCDEPTSKGRFL